MVLHKNEDRRHFLFSAPVLEMPDNRDSLPPAPPAAKAKAGAPLKNALYMPHSFLPTFQRCQHFVEEPLSALVRLTRSILGKFNVQ